MNYLGCYKITKIMSMRKDGQGFELVDVETGLSAVAVDPQMKRFIEAELEITDKGMMYTLMDVPENAPAEDIEKAKAQGLIYNDKYILDKKEIKIEEDGVYVYDSQKMLKGTEWVKITTDVEGELDLVMYKYEKIK